MSQLHTVAQGETLVSIAHQYGFRSWEVIWQHADNAALRSRRDPFVLAPGDAVAIPPKKPREELVGTGQRLSFKAKTLKAHVRLVLHDPQDQPYAGKEFELAAGGKTVSGITDEAGVLNADVPVDAKEATLKLFAKDGEEPLEWHLQLGHLDPVDTDAGVLARLRNLGHELGEATALDVEPVQKALRQFQKERGIPVTGAADARTRQNLVQAHDGK